MQDLTARGGGSRSAVGPLVKSQVSVPSAHHWPWNRAPTSTWVTGLSCQPDMVPCFGRSPKQHPGTHIPQPQASYQKSRQRPLPGLPCPASPRPISNPSEFCRAGARNEGSFWGLGVPVHTSTQTRPHMHACPRARGQARPLHLPAQDPPIGRTCLVT